MKTHKGKIAYWLLAGFMAISLTGSLILPSTAMAQSTNTSLQTQSATSASTATGGTAINVSGNVASAGGVSFGHADANALALSTAVNLATSCQNNTVLGLIAALLGGDFPC